jgi:hypothetical protein
MIHYSDSEIAESLYEGTWLCYGAGEVGCPVFSSLIDDDIPVGELAGDNGANRFYNPSGEMWAESIDDHLAQFVSTTRDILNRQMLDNPLDAEDRKRMELGIAL